MLRRISVTSIGLSNHGHGVCRWGSKMCGFVIRLLFTLCSWVRSYGSFPLVISSCCKPPSTRHEFKSFLVKETMLDSPNDQLSHIPLTFTHFPPPSRTCLRIRNRKVRFRLCDVKNQMRHRWLAVRK